MNRSVVALWLFSVALAGMSTACSAHSDSAGGPQPAAPSSGPVFTGHTGDTLTLTRANGAKVAVTLDKVINPATVTPGNGDAGFTYIATQLEIANQGTETVNGNANTNVSVFGSDGQSYGPDLNNVRECTNFDSGMFHLAPNETASGCVVFALPKGVDAAKVKYAPSSGFANDFGEWQLP